MTADWTDGKPTDREISVRLNPKNALFDVGQ